MKRVIAGAVAAYCAIAANAAEEVNLKTLAAYGVENEPSRFVLGTGDYSDSDWGWTKERVYDGIVELDNGGKTDWRWFEPGWVNSVNEDAWAGYGVTKPVAVTCIRFMPRHDEYASRAVGCRFQGANSADFSDAVTLYTIPETPVETLQSGWQEVTAFDAPLQAFKYLRVIGDYCGNMIEVEFHGMAWEDMENEAPTAVPQNLAISSTDRETGNVTLAWDAPQEPCISAKVIRSTAPGGTTFDVTATLASSVTTYTDSDASRVPGVTYYYRVAFANGENAGAASDVVSCRHSARIPVAIGENGASAVEFDYDYGSNDAKTKTSAANLFDGDTTTKPDVVNSSAGNTGVAVGVDFGEGNECVVTGFSVFPSREWNDTLKQWVVGRSDGTVLNGSNDTADWKNGTAISDACDIYEENVWDEDSLSWHYFETTGTAAPYRYIYLTKPQRENLQDQRTDDFYGNVRELQLYGWNAAAAAAVLTSPDDANAEWYGSRVNLSWTAAGAAAAYRIERRADGGTWTVVASGLTHCSFRDEPPRPTRETYEYRVGAVDGSGDTAYTATLQPAGTPSERGLIITVR